MFRLVECPDPGNIVADIDTYRAGGEWVPDVGEVSKSSKGRALRGPRQAACLAAPAKPAYCTSTHC